MVPDRTILHLLKKNPRSPPPLKNYGMHTIKPQLCPCIVKFKQTRVFIVRVTVLSQICFNLSQALNREPL